MDFTYCVSTQDFTICPIEIRSIINRLIKTGNQAFYRREQSDKLVTDLTQDMENAMKALNVKGYVVVMLTDREKMLSDLWYVTADGTKLQSGSLS